MRALYRSILALLPRRFDDRDRSEILDTYDARVARARRLGRASSLRTQLVEIADLSWAVVRDRVPRGLRDSALGDVRFALRSLRRSWLTSALAVVSLALGIGATSAIYSALDVWVFRPLPLPEARSLVAVAMANREQGWNDNVFSPRDLFDWRAASRVVALAGYRGSTGDVATPDGARRIETLEVSANLLEVLGLAPQAGRDLTSEDEQPGARVALVSEGFAVRQYGSVTASLGASLRLSGETVTVVGVLPAMVGVPEMQAEVWAPLVLTVASPRDGHSIYGIGRLGAGASISVAAEELDIVAATVAARDPSRTFPNARVRPLREVLYPEELSLGGTVLGSAVLLVLLIACANISNLLLARGASRSREIALRAALGADRSRLVRQLLTESLVLAALGGMAAVGVAFVGIELLVRYVLPADVPGLGQITLSVRVLTFTAVLSLVSTLIFGLVPALRTSRIDLRGQLHAHEGGSGPGRRSLLGRSLVVAEITLALGLLAGSGLLVRTLARLQSTEMGFRTDEALSFSLYVPPAVRDDASGVAAFHRQVLEEIAALPGVAGVAGSSGPPLGGWSSLLYSEPGTTGGETARRSAENRVVTSQYQPLMHMRLAAGRWFSDDRDHASSEKVAVVSRVLAEQQWGSAAGALGKQLELDGDVWTVVGVAEAGRIRGPQRRAPALVFRPYEQAPTRNLFYVVDTSGSRSELLLLIQERLRRLEPSLAIYRPGTLEDLLRRELEAEEASLRILATLACLALVLTVVGVYGVTAHSVRRRAREMGVRLAMGASAWGLLRLVLAQNLRLAALGLALGLGTALMLGRGLSLFLADVRAFDPLVMGLVALLMLLAVVVATLVPARRASRADPTASLRAE